MTGPPDAASALALLDGALDRGAASAEDARDLAALQAAEAVALGRKSTLADIQRALGSFDAQDRPRVGQRVNEVREALRAAFAARREVLEGDDERRLLEADRVDLTLPGRRPRPGSVHPLSIMMDRIVEVFTRLGYRAVEGPEVETEWYNFDALNIPADHPARTEKDTFYLDVPGRTDLLLRTETSAMQIRTMELQPPPVHVVAPGRVFRQDTADPTHSPVFHQVEGLAVDEGITFADLKGTLQEFARAMFSSDLRVKFEPDYFPFVEPGAQLSVSCFVCGGSGCRTCKGEGWIELLGCGMVHPNVLSNVGYDPERYTGFAFGLGVERVALASLGVPDIRWFYDGDVRFLAQFGALA